jgi:hypothetical protein
VPPKRHGECHATCPEYTEQKAKHDAEREKFRKARRTQVDITGQKVDGAIRANRRKKVK